MNHFFLLLSVANLAISAMTVSAAKADPFLESRVINLEAQYRRLERRVHALEREGGGHPGRTVESVVNLDCTDTIYKSRPSSYPSLDEVLNWTEECRTAATHQPDCSIQEQLPDLACFERMKSYRASSYPSSEDVSKLMDACRRLKFSCRY